MTEKTATLEIIAPTIEEAIEKGLQNLGLPRESVDVEILDEGSKGLFGLRSRQARIRLRIKETGPLIEQATIKEKTDSHSEKESNAEVEDKTPTATSPDIQTSSENKVLLVAKETIDELLQKMNVNAEVSVHFGEMDDKSGTKPLLVDINGNDLSILIGKNAETLNAIQYIARLIISREIGKAIYLIVDVEGYRTRKEQQLQKIAARMAEEVIERGRSLALEPMPPNERRIIHIALKDHPKVYTESTGEGSHRKVVIYPK